jgi:two-component system sensor histidine kinase KdpD
LLRFALVAITTLAAATVAVWLLQDVQGVPNPSAVYLVAVVAVAITSGTLGGIATAVASFFLYNFFFTEPRYTLSMHEPGVWLSVVLLLFVGIVVGQLAALQKSRAEVAKRREREARALFSVSRLLATRESIDAVLAAVAHELETDARMEQVIITTGTGDAMSHAFDARGVINQLRRMPGETPPQWVRVHQPAARARTAHDDTVPTEVYRVLIESSGDAIGSIWGLRSRGAGEPGPHETRLLAATADQLGQAIAHDRMAADAHMAEIARESDALKSALLQTVSHDLRTPLATIRAAAGTLRADRSPDDDVARESVDAIDREVDYLNRLVSNLLDLSRIEAGVLHAALDAFELDDLVKSVLDRLGGRLDGWIVENAVGTQPVRVDPVFFEAALTNVLENEVRHTPQGTRIRLSARPFAATTSGADHVVLAIEDSGPGVPDLAYDRLFEKFYRVPGRRSSRSGTGIGLAVARGLVEAMGGAISARRSELGGLAVDIRLVAANVPAELATTAATQAPAASAASA